MEKKNYLREINSYSNGVDVKNTNAEVKKNEELIGARRFFQETFDANYITAMKKIFGALSDVNLTEEEKKSLINIYPQLLEYSVTSAPSEEEDEYYRMFLSYVDNATRYCTKLAEGGIHEYHEYQILGVDAARDAIIREHGEYVYYRAVMEVPFRVSSNNSSLGKRDFEVSSRKLCCLVDGDVPKSPVIDLDLYRKYLGFKGIETAVDYDNNIFIFGKRKEDTILNGQQVLAYRSEIK